ncbi:hypothetical protein B484DRAFT_53134 [Ochromonadaceae sp. CCMP2298]|nr:hypothetical protein B484DRAFT_53134 [Ochromonadaceae sp. CCMP2298]
MLDPKPPLPPTNTYDRGELILAHRMCRGPEGSWATRGCWIGLQDKRGTGDFGWIQSRALGKVGGRVSGEFNSSTFVPQQGTFLDWRRQEPNNHSISDGVPAKGGERCGALVGWQSDPLVQEQGSWNDDSCETLKPFVCQMVAATMRSTVTVTGATVLSGGVEIIGGRLLMGVGVGGLAGGVSELHNCVASTAELVVSSSSTSSCLLGNVTLSGGSSLSLGGDVRTLSNAALGERVLSADEVEARKAGVGDGSVDGTDTALTMQPLITLLSTAVLTVGADCTGSLQSCDSLHTRVSINARLNVLGSVMVEADSTLALLQGADMSSSDISIASGGVLELAGYASRLSTYDSYELQVSQRGIYVGEWSDNLAQEELNEHSGVQIGVYRIALSALGASGAPTQVKA